MADIRAYITGSPQNSVDVSMVAIPQVNIELGGKGPQGVPGTPGLDGKDGTPGKDGSASPLDLWQALISKHYQGLFGPHQAYVPDSIVVFGNNFYSAQGVVPPGVTPGTDPRYWHMLPPISLGPKPPVVGPPGRDGAEWFTGPGNPDITQGIPHGAAPGDYYLNTTTGEYFEMS